MITDLGNDLLSCQAWDVNELSSPRAPKLKDSPPLDFSAPFAQALATDFFVPVDAWGHRFFNR